MLTSAIELQDGENEVEAVDRVLREVASSDVRTDIDQLTRFRRNDGRVDLVRLLGFWRLRTLPTEFRRLERLTELDVTECGLIELPRDIGDIFPALARLCVRNNGLRELPHSIGRLRQLKSIEADINVISQLPDSVGDLHELERLNLSQNKLVTLPVALE